MSRRPLHHEGSKKWEAGNLFLTLEWSPLHAIYKKYVTCHLPYSDALLGLIDALRIAKEPNIARSQYSWRKTYNVAIRKLIANLLVPSPVYNLQLANCSLEKKVVLSSQSSSSNVLANNRIHTVIVADILVCICWQLTNCKGLPEIAYK